MKSHPIVKHNCRAPTLTRNGDLIQDLFDLSFRYATQSPQVQVQLFDVTVDLIGRRAVNSRREKRPARKWFRSGRSKIHSYIYIIIVNILFDNNVNLIGNVMSYLRLFYGSPVRKYVDIVLRDDPAVGVGQRPLRDMRVGVRHKSVADPVPGQVVRGAHVFRTLYQDGHVCVRVAAKKVSTEISRDGRQRKKRPEKCRRSTAALVN